MPIRYIRKIFPFDKDIAYDILGLIGEKGGLVENQITSHLATGTRRRVSWAITKFLIPNGFLIAKRTKKSRRNVKNAFGKGKEIHPNVYYLTLKGFLASLATISPRQNYIMKQYLALFPDEIRKYVLEYTENEIKLYAIYNALLGVTINSIKDLVYHMGDFDPSWENLDIPPVIRQRIDKIEQRTSILSEMLQPKKGDSYFIEQWPENMELIINEKYDEITVKSDGKPLEFRINTDGYPTDRPEHDITFVSNGKEYKFPQVGYSKDLTSE